MHAQIYWNKLTKKRRISAEKHKNKKHGAILFIRPAVPVIWQQRVAGGGGGGVN